MLKTSRREFLSASAMLPVLGAGSKAGFLAPPDKPVQPVKLDYRTLGKTGLKVTTMGMGCMITSDPSVVARALDLGVNYFDTARGYQHGNNERMVGAALGARRRDIVLATKSSANTRENLLKDLDTSLAELKTDHVDIWFLHAKDSPSAIHDDMVEAQQIAKQQGKIRFSGMSTHALPQMTPWTTDKRAFDVVLAICNFSISQKQDESLAALAKAGVGVVGMKNMAGGFRDLKPDSPIYPKLKQEGGMVAALKWAINRPYISTTIPSMTDMDQLEDNIRAMGHPLSAADEKLLAQRLEQIRPLYCRTCGECTGMCPKGIEVASMLRILTYAEGYGQFALARERFNELPAHHASIRCGDCADCPIHCPHGVEVRSRLTRAQELFA